MTSDALVREGRILAGDPLSAEVALSAGCGGCQRCGFDPGGRPGIRLAWPLPERPPTLGQRVNLVASTLGVMRACVVLFGLPMLAWLVGALVGTLLFDEGAAIVGYLALIVIAWLISANRYPLERWFDVGLRVEPLPANGGSGSKPTRKNARTAFLRPIEVTFGNEHVDEYSDDEDFGAELR